MKKLFNRIKLAYEDELYAHGSCLLPEDLKKAAQEHEDILSVADDMDLIKSKYKSEANLENVNTAIEKLDKSILQTTPDWFIPTPNEFTTYNEWRDSIIDADLDPDEINHSQFYNILNNED